MIRNDIKTRFIVSATIAGGMSFSMSLVMSFMMTWIYSPGLPLPSFLLNWLVSWRYAFPMAWPLALLFVYLLIPRLLALSTRLTALLCEARDNTVDGSE